MEITAKVQLAHASNGWTISVEQKEQNLADNTSRFVVIEGLKENPNVPDMMSRLKSALGDLVCDMIRATNRGNSIKRQFELKLDVCENSNSL